MITITRNVGSKKGPGSVTTINFLSPGVYPGQEVNSLSLKGNMTKRLREDDIIEEMNEARKKIKYLRQVTENIRYNCEQLWDQIPIREDAREDLQHEFGLLWEIHNELSDWDDVLWHNERGYIAQNPSK